LKDKLINSIIVSIVFAFNLCIFGPLEFFYLNIFDFWFSIKQVLPIIICIFAIITTMVFFLLYFTKNKLNNILVKIIFMMTICLYIQGNYFNIGYSVLDGSSVDWSSMILKGIINTIIWIFILIVPFIIKKFKEKEFFCKFSNITSLFVLGIEIITLVIIIWSAYMVGASSNIQMDSTFYLDSSDIYNISKEENIIVFVSDTFEATYMNEILEKYPEYKEKLEDFTYFDNTTGASLMTYSAMPTILTGQNCLVGKNLKQNIKYCFENTELYDVLKKNGYDVELYTDINLISAEEDKITNKVDKELIMNNDSRYKVTKLLYKCVLYKYLPHFLKSSFIVDTAEFNKIDLKDVNQYSFDDVKFNNMLIENGIKVNNGNKKYKLYHLNGVHTPYYVTEEIEYDTSSEYLNLDEDARRKNQTKASLNILINYIEKLKESDSYNNSTIIFMADHGWENRYHINLMIKPKNVNRDFNISHAPISVAEDFVPTILNIATESKEYGNDIFSYSESEERTRKIYNYTFTRGDNTYNVLSKITIATDSDAADTEKYYIMESEYADSDKVPQKQYVFGKEIDILKGINNKYVVLEGFLTQNIRSTAKGVNIGKDTKIKLKVPKTEKDVTATICLEEVFYDDQNISIKIEDKVLFEKELDIIDSNKKINFIIPKEIWNNNENLEILIQFPNGKLGDPSTLGEETLVMSMRLKKIIFNK